jgi:hypothetical protein
MDVAERQRLLDESIPEDPERPDSTRYTFRIGAAGHEWFAARFTRMVNDEPEFHGYPCSHVPVKVLRTLRDGGRISDALYRKLVKELG